MRKFTFFLLVLFISLHGSTQDSAWIQLRPKYNKVGSLHRVFFGENYRREWSDSTRLPVIRLSKIDGGLKPLKLGGGHQTVSLRLISANGREWVLRTIEKDASVLLPVEARETFAREVLDDAMSAQHPFSPLVVAALAEAAQVPHSEPLIGIVSEDTLLGEFYKQFAGKPCLVEEREPLGESDNSAKMFEELDEDNDNSIDSKAFLQARLLDLLIADWDRHPDQWRWLDNKKGKSKFYIGIPRDRDQAFYVNQGIFPGIASRPWLVPILQGFEGEIRKVKFSLKEGSFMQSRPAMQMPFAEWMRITHEFVQRLPDTVLRKAIRRLPESAWKIRHEQIFNVLKQRRDNIPSAIEDYYRFINRIVELRLSDKHESISITDTTGKALLVTIDKIDKVGGRQQIMSALYTPEITKELILYSGKGNDSVTINNLNSPIRIRLIGDEGNKKYNVIQSSRDLRVYDKKNNGSYYGKTEKLRLRLSDDSLNTAYVPANRYNIFKPIITGGFNRDDGFLLGLGFQYIHQGFRKSPYASMNRLVLYHSFATSAYRIKYSGEWMKVFGNTDIVANAEVFAPQNTKNFFGRGNETVFNKTGDYLTYYRARFSMYKFSAGLQWKNKNGWSFSAGPALERYSYDSADNKGRFLVNGSHINSYDSSTLSRSKTHAGAFLNFIVNKKNNTVIPSAGYCFTARLEGYGGLNNYSKSFAQLVPEFSVYTALNSSRSIILANRIGGGISVGKPAFYQSLYAGGHDNLLGYRQYRFAGDHLLYNNLEARIRLANFTGYILPGELGMIAFYDVGRVWIRQESSKKWHQGTGGGLYFAPAKLVVGSIVAGYSKEGWYPYITIGFRF